MEFTHAIKSLYRNFFIGTKWIWDWPLEWEIIQIEEFPSNDILVPPFSPLEAKGVYLRA